MHCSKKLVLDFDGTIFRVFTNHDLKKLVFKIFNLLKDYPTNFKEDSDAFDAFSCVWNADLSSQIKTQLLTQIDEWMVTEEKEAIQTGILVDGFFEFLNIVQKESVDIAIVSNNSEACIHAFFQHFGLDTPCAVLGRIGVEPDKMKPNTYMLEKISQVLNCQKEEILFIGDNFRDYECAEAFGCSFIGMTPTPGKKERLIKKAPQVITVDDFFVLIDMLPNIK